ncbi:PAS domain S-box protein [Porifericola rhodea]|uniref:PAS domain S-box protein n=1 Tax=Porifericola rhodea TaxID=930972 RepID=UPI0026670406|nr:PAS domain S-box protein [Porifericola rhodea]WKN33247.1 PAS domain S-box protein [Porifericola rhodea]
MRKTPQYLKMDKGKLNEIFNDATEAVVIFDQQGSVIFLNSAAANLFQYSSADAEGKSIFDLIEQDVHYEIRSYLHQRPTQPEQSFFEQKAFIIRQDEQILPVSFQLSTITHEKSNIYMMVIEALAAGEDALSLNYKLLADNIPDIVSLYNAQHQCLYVNLAVRQIYGYRQAEYIGIGGFFELIVDEDKARLQQEIAEDTRNRVALKTYTYRAYQSNGDLIQVQNVVKRTYDTQGELSRLIAYEKKLAQDRESVPPPAPETALFLLDAQWKVNYISSSAHKLLDTQGLEQQAFTDLLHPEDQPKILKAKEEAVLNGISSTQNLIRIKQGDTYLRVRAMLDRFYNDKGEQTHATVRLYPIQEFDIAPELPTPHYLHLIAKHVEEVVCFFQQDYTIKYISPSVFQLLGYSSQELEGKQLIDFVHTDDKLKAQIYFQNASKLKAETLRCSFVCKDGATIKLELDFRIIEEPIQSRDTLPLLLILKQPIHTSNNTEPSALFEEVFHYLADGIALIELPSQKLTKVNPKFLEVFQADTEDAISTDLSQLFDQCIDISPLVKALQDKKALQQNFKCVNLKKQSFWANVALSFFQAGGQTYALLRISDISDFKQNEEKLQEAWAEAEQTLKTREEFLSTMSHEIRTPLNAVLGMTHLMLQGTPREDQIKLLQTLKFSGDSLTALINDVLDYSKIEAGKLEFAKDDFNLREFLQGIKMTYKSLAQEKGLLFRTLVEDELPEVLNGDVNRLGQILNNLLSNAIKFTEDGQITLSICVDKETEEKIILLFEVVDTGIGIPDNKQAVIFDPYKQASERTSQYFGGTGLGLSIVKKLVDMFDGEIELLSEENKGSTFKVKIPFNKSELAISHPSQSDQSFIHKFQPLDGLKVLYVEDVIPNQFLMEGLCDTWHIQLDTALNGLEALDKVKQNHYDLILMDIQMPEMDGFEAAQEIRKLEDPHYSNIPILALSASVSDRTRLRIKENGMNDYIAKPIDPKDLHHKLSFFSSIKANSLVAPAAEMGEGENDVLTENILLDNPDFSQLKALYINDIPDYVKILEQILKLTESSNVSILNALKISNVEMFRVNNHKLMSYVRLMRLEHLEEVIDEIKAQFDSQNPSFDDLAPVIKLHLNNFIHNLKREIEDHKL